MACNEAIEGSRKNVTYEIFFHLQFSQEPNVRLTHNVEIWQTPGRNDMHNSVIVRNVPDQGSVAVSGIRSDADG